MLMCVCPCVSVCVRVYFLEAFFGLLGLQGKHNLYMHRMHLDYLGRIPELQFQLLIAVKLSGQPPTLLHFDLNLNYVYLYIPKTFLPRSFLHLIAFCSKDWTVTLSSRIDN